MKMAGFPSFALRHSPVWRRPAAMAAVVGALLAVAAARGDEAEDQFNFATGLLIKNEPQLAAGEFKALLEKHPNFHSADIALYRLGEALSKADDSAGAIAALKTLTTKYPQSEKLCQATYRLAQLTASTDHVVAAGYYGTVAEKWPDNPLAEAAAYWCAEEFFKAEAWDKAVAAYENVLKRYPEGKYPAHALYSLGWVHFKRGDYPAALKAFDEFVGKYPKHDLTPECKLKKAECLQKLKRYDEAAKLYAQLASSGGTFATEAAIGRAWTLYEQKQLTPSAQAFQEAAAMLDNDPRAAVCLFNAGNALVESSAWKDAVEVFDAMLKDFPQHTLLPAARYWKAYCLVQLGKFAEAVPLLEALKKDGSLNDKAIELDYTLAEAKMGLNDYRTAAELYGGICKTAPTNALADEAAYGRMLALDKAGDVNAAEAAGDAFFAAYGSSENANLARFALAEYRFRLGKYDAAAKDFETFLAGKTTADLADDAQYKLGWCAMHTKNAARARERFANVVKDSPDSALAAESAFMEGRAAEELGDTAGATAAYETCLKCWPDTDYARRSDLALTFLSIGAGDYNGALTRADAFLKKNPDSELARFARLYRGEALLELDRPEDALAAYSQVGGGTNGAAIDATYGRAWACRKLGRHEDAAKLFGEVVAAKSLKADDAAFWRCRSLEDAEKWADAAGAYGAFLGNYPKSAHADEAAYRRALCRFKNQDYGEAERLYKEFAGTRADSELAPHALYDLAWLHLERKEGDKAEAALSQLLERYPKSPLAADVEFRLGELAYAREDFAGAAKRYEQALTHNDVAFADKVLYKLGWSRQREGDAPGALTAFVRIAKEFPQSELAPEAHYRAGRLLEDQKRYDEARAEYAAVGEGEFAERALFQTAECRRAADQQKDALEAYAKLLATYPKSEFAVAANLGRGHAYRAVGAFKDALEAYEAVVKATDTIDAAAALLGEGYVYFAQADYANAAKAFLKVDILYGYDEVKPEALSMLAKTWEKVGDADKAKKYRDELKRRYPESPFAKE